MQTTKNNALGVLKTLYIIGLIPSVIVVLIYIGEPSNSPYMIYGVLFALWGGLVYCGAYLAVKKGREPVEGAVLGAFGPIGFIIEVLLPPMKTEGSTKPPNPS